MRLTLPAASACAVAVLGLSACSTSAPTPAVTTAPVPSAPSTTASASIRASSSTSNASPSPSFSAAHDAAGVEAFTRYYFQQVQRAYATGDTTTLRDLSEVDCAACHNYIDSVNNIYGAGHRLEGVGLTLTDVFPVVTDSGGAATFRSAEADTTTVDASGKIIAKNTASAPASLLVVVRFDNGRWTTVEVGPASST